MVLLILVLGAIASAFLLLNRVANSVFPPEQIRERALHFAKELRAKMTPAEKLLWAQLRKRSGCKYHRQHPLYYNDLGRWRFVIVDFYCHSHKTIIELDGEIHKQQEGYDRWRDQIFAEQSFTIIRLPNEAITENCLIKFCAPV